MTVFQSSLPGSQLSNAKPASVSSTASSQFRTTSAYLILRSFRLLTVRILPGALTYINDKRPAREYTKADIITTTIETFEHKRLVYRCSRLGRLAYNAPNGRHLSFFQLASDGCSRREKIKISLLAQTINVSKSRKSRNEIPEDPVL